MATSSSQSPKFTDEWIPYVALAYFVTFVVTEFFIAKFDKGLKTNILNIIGIFFLALMVYFFTKTDKKLVQEYLLPLVFTVVLFISGYMMLMKVFLF